MAVPETLRKLLTAAGPSGYEQAPAAVFRDAASAFAEVSYDSVGSTVAKVPGTHTDPPARSVAIVGHIDEIGLIVHHIDDDGFLWFTDVGGWDPVILVGQRVEIAMMRTPDGHSRIELSRFEAPAIESDHRTAPVNSLGYLRVLFTVKDLDDTLARLRKLGATVVDEVVNYENIYRLCYIRGPEGILIGLAQQLGQQTSRENPIEGQA